MQDKKRQRKSSGDTVPAIKVYQYSQYRLLEKNADELKRVAASVFTRTVTASLLNDKLQSYPRHNNLMYVSLSYGQLVKRSTRAAPFICKYLLQLPLTHHINTHLNKGEQLHNLRVYLWLGGDGIIRKK